MPLHLKKLYASIAETSHNSLRHPKWYNVCLVLIRQTATELYTNLLV